MGSATTMRIAVTRARGGADRLVAALRKAGFETADCPLIRIEAIEGPPIRAEGYEWVVLTSAPAVELLLSRLEGPLPRTAVVGPGTAEALREHGRKPDLVATKSTQEGLLAELRPRVGAGARVLFAGAQGARDLIARELSADVVHLYRTVEERPHAFPDADIVVVASASAARSFAALRIDRPVVSIGPVTTAEARRTGLNVLAEAERHDLEGLVAAVRLAASLLQSSPS